MIHARWSRRARITGQKGRRRQYAALTAGYHLNKRHWNTITFDGSVPEHELLDLMGHSSELVVARLPRAERDKLNT